MVTPDPTYWGFFVFGILAGLCPCNTVLCLALIGSVAGDGAVRYPLRDSLKLTLPFGIGTLLVLAPLGGIVAYIGKSVILFNASFAYASSGAVMLIMALQLFGFIICLSGIFLCAYVCPHHSLHWEHSCLVCHLGL